MIPIRGLSWIVSVVGVTILLHITFWLVFYFFEKNYLKNNRVVPRYIRIIYHTAITFIWISALFLSSYAFLKAETYETITSSFLRVTWIGFVVLVTVILNAISLTFFNKRIREYSLADEKDPTSFKFFKNVVSLFIYFASAILIALSFPALQSIAKAVLAGAGVLAIVIGIASQEVLANIVGGTFIVIFKPFRINDIIKINSIEGRVEDITLRHSVVTDFQNKRIVIPNAILNKEQIINYNLIENKICEWIEMDISYDSDIDRALAIMQDEAMSHPYFYDNRSHSEIHRKESPVRAKVIGFGDSGVKLRAWVWARNYSAGVNLRRDLYKSIKERFEKEGIEIPYSYLNVILKSKIDKDDR